MKVWEKAFSALVLFWGFAGTGQADLNLEITGGMDIGRKIVVVPFGGQSAAREDQDLAGIIAADLTRSGVFSPVAAGGQKASTGDEVRTSDFPAGTEAVVVGRVAKGASGYVVNFELVSLTSGNPLVIQGVKADVPAGRLREYGHRISDQVYEKLTGTKGGFGTRIAYIKRSFASKHPYQLAVADYDGKNEKVLLVSSQPLMSPRWRNDGRTLAYVSFEQRKPQIYTLDIVSRSRKLITSFPGLNSNPAWSPDGSSLAMVLSKDGNPEIYVLNLAARSLKRITSNPGIDTEPSWSPDGRNLYFVSERAGAPQVFSVDLSSGAVSRVTRSPVKNLSPVVMPDNSGIVLINQNGGFRVSRQDFSGSLYSLTGTSLDESPTVSPGGNMIIYNTVKGGRSVLALVSANGRYREVLRNSGGEYYFPSWSGYAGK